MARTDPANFTVEQWLALASFALHKARGVAKATPTNRHAIAAIANIHLVFNERVSQLVTSEYIGSAQFSNAAATFETTKIDQLILPVEL